MLAVGWLRPSDYDDDGDDTDDTKSPRASLPEQTKVKGCPIQSMTLTNSETADRIHLCIQCINLLERGIYAGHTKLKLIWLKS